MANVTRPFDLLSSSCLGQAPASSIVSETVGRSILAPFPLSDPLRMSGDSEHRTGILESGTGVGTTTPTRMTAAPVQPPHMSSCRGMKDLGRVQRRSTEAREIFDYFGQWTPSLARHGSPLASGQEFRVLANKTCDVPCIKSFRSSPELLALMIHHPKSSQDAAADISMLPHFPFFCHCSSSSCCCHPSA
ncbi:hypothetical protein LX32DRAFT_110549 [Colletotrichum zoysiae]|uniref:Uncharacterized protein n=1 Tax=Colletotrichum zoysiae TaxID=1216348 RepID=A0AAD9LX34_9PEZI|nr:hypothetical protein LX32DRAFT_110549 [Colletotrichum zoysiae]